MASQRHDDDARMPVFRAMRSWVRTLATAGVILVALSAVVETLTRGSMRPIVGVLGGLGLIALIVAALGWVLGVGESETESAEEDDDVLGRPVRRRARADGDEAVEEAEEPVDEAEPDVEVEPDIVDEEAEEVRPRAVARRHRGRMRRQEEPADEEDVGPQRRLSEGTLNGDVRRLSQIKDAELGPTATRYMLRGRAPYVRRPAADGRLASLLKPDRAPHPFVVVVGEAKAGKSRTVVEAVRSVYGQRDPMVVIPEDGQDLANLLTPEPPTAPDRHPWVLWLDDLTAADLAHLSPEIVDRTTQHAVLIGTMTRERWDEIHSGSEIAENARAVLHRATKVPLEFHLTASERAEAAQLYPQERVTGSIGEALVGGEQLTERLRMGREAEPAGYAIVQAAIDARRAGLKRPITESELRRLYPLYLRRIRIDLDPTTALFAQGMAWATEPVASEVALLTRVSDRVGDRAQGDGAGGDGSGGGGPAGFEVLDYLVAAEEGRTVDGEEASEGRPIFDPMWQELLSAVPIDDAFDIGVTACLRGVVHAADAALRKVLESGHPDLAPRAANHLGLLLREQGDLSGARSAFQRAVDSGHPDVVPRAANNLGLLLRQQRDVAGARSAFQRAVDAGNSDVAPRAANNLGLLLREQGDVSGARMAFQRAAESGHSDVAALAAVNLGSLLRDQGDIAGARAAFQRAVDSGQPEAVPVAAVNLGSLLREQGDTMGARGAFQRAVDSGDPAVVPVAATNLGVLLRDQGDMVGARSAFQRAVDSGHPSVVPVAALNLGALLAEQEDIRAAEAAYQLAIDSGRADVVPMAAFCRASLLKQHGDIEGAKQAYELAAESRHPEIAPMALNNLGALLADQDDLDGARTAYQRAIESGHQEVAAMAANNLGALLAEHDDLAGAQAAYQVAAESGHPNAAPVASVNLGMLLEKQGDVAGAREAYRRAVDSGHPDVVQAAAVNLGVLLREQGDLAGARTAFHMAIDSGFFDIPPVKPSSRRVLLTEQSGAVGAQAAHQLAADIPPPSART